MPTPIYKNIEQDLVPADPPRATKGDEKFYTFRQNNSGGYFKENDNYGIVTIIAASTLGEAGRRGIDLGMYFNGVADGLDCECCGDRWSDYCVDGTDVPLVYESTPIEYLSQEWFGQKVIIHYADGSRQTFKKLPKE